MTAKQKRIIKRRIINKAKQIALGLTACAIFGAAFVMASKADYEAECYYVREVEVVSFDSRIDNVTTVDTEGNIWCFYGEGYRIGDDLSLMMDSKGTSTILDDEVVKVK
jgi:hypothetical protein